MIVTVKPTCTYYFINMKFSLDVAMDLFSCKAEMIFVKSDIYI